MVVKDCFEVTIDIPICAICGDVYVDEKALKDPFDEKNFFFGTNLHTNRKTWLGKPKRVRVEFCYDCMKAVELLRKGEKLGLVK